MGPRIGSLLLALCALVFTLPCAAAQAAEQSPAPAATSGERDVLATAAYRDGDLETARVLWVEELREGRDTLGANERARLCYNLGNLAARREAWLPASAWYTASLRLRPRDAETWANLELARLNAGLEAADRGDLKSTVERLLGSLTTGESRWLALLGLLPLAIALAGEALRGGLAWRAASWATLGLALLAALPWLRHAWVDGEHPVFVVAESSERARNEPRATASGVEALEPGAVLERVDALPGWIEVRFDDGRRGWAREDALFDLVR